MTHVVCKACFGCKYTDCVTVCPVECFYEGDQMLYIHPDECIDCEACVPECPVEAIFAEEDMPEDQGRFVDINTKYFELRDSAEDWAQWKQEHAADFEKKS